MHLWYGLFPIRYISTFCVICIVLSPIASSHADTYLPTPWVTVAIVVGSKVKFVLIAVMAYWVNTVPYGHHQFHCVWEGFEYNMFLYFAHGIVQSLQQLKLTPEHWSLRYASRAPLLSSPQKRTAMDVRAGAFSGELFVEKPFWRSSPLSLDAEKHALPTGTPLFHSLPEIWLRWGCCWIATFWAPLLLVW